MSDAMVLNRSTIKNLQLDLPNAIILALLIGKQEPRRFKPSTEYAQALHGTDERAVWNFTIRDSPRDYINVTYWGSAETVTSLNNIIQIGNLVEITCPRVTLRNNNDIGEQYRPSVTSPFNLTVNEGTGNVQKVREYCVENLMQLLHLPTKPMFNYTTINYVFTNIHQINGLLFDLLVAVRQVGELRFAQTKNGPREVRKVIVFDRSNPAMAITLWNPEYIARASLWKPRETVLFITDCKVQYDSFSNSATGTPSMRSIITENPEGNEASVLREHSKTAQLHSSTVMDQLVGIMPDAASIKTVMNIRQILTKIAQISIANSARVEDNQFAVILYAYVTHLDLDGVSRVFSTRCSLCKSLISEWDECKNAICLSNTSNQVMELDKTFDLRMEISDRTNTLKNCRLSGQNAENVFHCSPTVFSAMSDEQKAAIKWNYLMEFCELRLVILLKNKQPFITILTCVRADVSVHGIN